MSRSTARTPGGRFHCCQGIHAAVVRRQFLYLFRVKLYRDWYPSSGPVRAGIVFMHGYADHCGRYGELCRHLAGLGFPVMAFDYRGHGQAGGRRGHVDEFGEFLGDLDRACREARETLSDKPLAIVAHSNGALIALRAFCEPTIAPQGVKALVWP